MLHLLFPTAIHLSKNTEPLDSCRELFSKCPMLVSDTTTGFRTTLAGYNHKKSLVSWKVEEQEESVPLLRLIDHSVLEYMSEYRLKPHEIFIDGIWLNTMDSTSTHAVHAHYGHTFSGVYYVDVPEGSGKLSFYDHLSVTAHADLNSVVEVTSFNSLSWWVPVEEGTVVIFPSHLRHGVDKSDFKGIRRSIAFDISLVPLN